MKRSSALLICRPCFVRRGLLLAVLSSFLVGCYSHTPVYREAKSSGSNTETTYYRPAYTQEMNALGWGWLAATTAAGAYGGYVSGVELEWKTGEPERENKGANAALGGLAGLGLGLLTNAIFKPDIPTVTGENVRDWVGKIDRDLLLLNVPEENPLPFVTVINRNAESTFTPKNLRDVETFLALFPTSERTGPVIVEAASVVKGEELPKLYELSEDEEARRVVALKYLDRFSSIADLHKAGERFPIIADSAKARAVRSVASLQEARAFRVAYDDVEPILPYLREAAKTTDREEMRTIITSFPMLEEIDSLKLRYVRSASSVPQIREAVELFPEHLHLLEETTASIARDEDGWETYLDLFPEGQHASRFRILLEEARRPPERLSGAINTAAREYGPVISPDGKTLYIIRRFDPRNTGGGGDEEIWYSELRSDGSWSTARQIGSGLNTESHDGVKSVTPDGNTLLLHSPYLTTPALISHRTKRGWSKPEELRVEGYVSRSSYHQSYLSNDGRTLLMSNSESYSGDNDLYVSFRGDDGTWSTPQHLGYGINTDGEEASPFLAADGKTLYFSSDGHGGFGGSDLFVSRRSDDSWLVWSEPENLGERINTAGGDQFFFIPASGRYAYFSRELEEDGHSDIFRVTLPPGVRPLPVVLIEGKVTASHNGAPLDATIVYENLMTGLQTGTARTDPATGGYKIALPAGAQYGFRAEAENYLSISEHIDLTDLLEYQEMKVDLSMIPIRSGERLRLNNLFFETGRADIRSESFPELNRIASFLSTHRSVSVRIEGHTDSVGTVGDNYNLSVRRAEAVVGYLRDAGISADSLEGKGLGEENPVEDNGTEEGRRANRRVEFVIVEVK